MAIITTLLKLDRTPAERSDVHIHLVGIGGTGLSAIATLLIEMGYTVSGSDQRPNEATAGLTAEGVQIFTGHRAENVAGADLVLISSAVPADNPEVMAAEAAGIPVVKRADFLGPLMAGQHGVGVAGAHGKTTTTSMIAIILWRCGFDPSFIVGGRLAVGPGEGMPSTTIAARAGRGPFVIEADEYDRMFLGLELETAVVTNVEWDHVDCYPSPRAFVDAFRAFVGKLSWGGHLVLCADDVAALALRDAAQEGVRIETYGLSAEADWQARELTGNQIGGLDAAVWHSGQLVARLSLAVPGRHNVRNALAALAVAEWFGIPPVRAARTLQDFHGTGRRFEIIGEAGEVTVIDDYAHHPTEIAATLAAARLRFGSRKIRVIFQPHTYSRTQALLDDFANSFDDADEVLLLDIYPAREKIDLGMHSRLLLERMTHPGARYVGSIEAAADYLLAQVQPEDVVITMSAGDGNRAGQLLLAGLRRRENGA
jgi:UDP-N-acetylmuramate--alanine ligase